MDSHALSTLLENWSIPHPLAFTSLAGGTNNQSWLVETEDGSRYVLRLIAGSADLSRFRYEHALLNALQAKPLPFALPHPLPVPNGAGFVLFEQERAKPALAVLTLFLPGRIPERNAANTARAGMALAQLDAALASIPTSTLPLNSREAQFQYGDLSHCHLLVPDPFAAAEQLLAPEQGRPLRAIFSQSLSDWETPGFQHLPQQLLHRDCGPGNVLMEDERISAILDFEFASMDRRIFDLCVALSWWPVRFMGSGREWELIDALGRAYTTSLPLAESELLALPAALRMRDTTSLVYRMGRYLAGLESMQTVQERAQHSLWREAWLATNYENVKQHALSWQASPG